MGRKKTAIGKFEELWGKFEQLYCTIFYEALKRLKIDDILSKTEDVISEFLYLKLKDRCSQLGEIKPPILPIPQMPIPPEGVNDITDGKSRKIPDFTCMQINTLESPSKAYMIHLHIECKRLGKTTGSPLLNRKYYFEGMKRFDSTDHEYGKRVPSGMMVGYMVNMEPNSILDAVNKHIPEEIPNLVFDFKEKVSSFDQGIIRNQVEPKDFKLIHLWADLRN